MLLSLGFFFFFFFCIYSLLVSPLSHRIVHTHTKWLCANAMPPMKELMDSHKWLNGYVSLYWVPVECVLCTKYTPLRCTQSLSSSSSSIGINGQCSLGETGKSISRVYTIHILFQFRMAHVDSGEATNRNEIRTILCFVSRCQAQRDGKRSCRPGGTKFYVCARAPCLAAVCQTLLYNERRLIAIHYPIDAMNK